MTAALSTFCATIFLSLLASGLMGHCWHIHPVRSDREEKFYLGVMVLPVILGIAVLILNAFVPFKANPLIRADFTMVLAQIAPSSKVEFYTTDVWLGTLEMLCFLYLLMISLKAVRLLQAISTLRGLARSASVKDVTGTKVSLSSEAAFPMLLSQKIIMLPLSFVDHFTHDELRLVILHERMHQSRGDAAWFMFLAWVDVLFWFNPFVRQQANRSRIAAEKACDDAVVRLAPQDRDLYARTLIKTLKHSAKLSPPCVPAAMVGQRPAEYRLRLENIIKPQLQRPAARTRLLIIGILAPICFSQVVFAQVVQPSDHYEGQSLETTTGCRKRIAEKPACSFEADYVQVNGNTRLLTASGSVRLNNGPRQIVADKLVLDTNTGKATFVGNVVAKSAILQAIGD